MCLDAILHYVVIRWLNQYSGAVSTFISIDLFCLKNIFLGTYIWCCLDPYHSFLLQHKAYHSHILGGLELGGKELLIWNRKCLHTVDIEQTMVKKTFKELLLHMALWQLHLHCAH